MERLKDEELFEIEGGDWIDGGVGLLYAAIVCLAFV
jgi:hypothetical protein